MHCSVARTLDVIGDWWTPLILRDVFTGLTKFDEIQADLGISRKVLTQRLESLVEHRVLQRVAYQEHPPRHDYLPTEMGLDLLPVLMAMIAFGDKWLSEAPPVRVRHATCGKLTVAVPACAECGEELTPQDIRLEAGPGLAGASDEEAAAARRRLERYAEIVG